MRYRYVIGAALSAVAAGSLAAPLGSNASTASQGPTKAEIRKAVDSAERSAELWATVNICNTRRHPHEVGIRGQIPALGFMAGLYMTFEVEYRTSAQRTFSIEPGIKQHLYLGRASSKLHQAGITVRFTSPATFAGRVQFTWKLDGKVIGQVVRRTTGGHKHVDFADPRGHSAAVCVVG